jgi:hypothetical protein
MNRGQALLGAAVFVTGNALAPNPSGAEAPSEALRAAVT